MWQKKSFWAAIIVVVLASAGAGWYFLGGPGSPYINATAQSTPAFNTANVRLGDLQISASGTGTLVASRTVDLSFSSSGTLMDLNVKLGDKVKTGQVLAKLGNSSSLQSTVASSQLLYLQAQKTLTDLQQNASVTLAQAYQDWITAKETYSSAYLSNQRSDMARCTKEVNTQLVVKLATAKAQLDKETKSDMGSTAWIAAKSEYDNALANYNFCIAYTPLEKTQTAAALDVADSAVKQAELKYNTLKAASGIDPQELTLAEASVEAARTKLDNATSNLAGVTLTAPIDGTVTYLGAGQGTIVDTAKFITISDLSQPSISVSLDETDLDQLTVGNQAEIVFDALPGRVFTGTVAQVEPQLVASGQYSTAKGLVVLDPTGSGEIQSLPLGLNAKVTIISQKAANALLVPVEALRDLGNKQYAVFVLGSDGKLRLTTVDVGLMDSVQAVITRGLSAGEVVSTGTVPTSK
jgi:HlyD family secretion protein